MTPEIIKRIEQIRRGEVPEGYKKGKLGIAPCEWDNMSFSALFTSTSDFTDDLLKYPLYSLTIENGIIAKTERYERSHLVKKNEAYKIVRPNDYAYNPMNIRFGAVARHKGNIPVAVSGYYDIFTTIAPSDMPFMDNLLTWNSMITFYNKVSTGSLVEKQRVHFSQFMEFFFPLPTLEERAKIAEILTVQDKVIELKEKRIAEKQRQKKYLMQQLLAGKKRLPGFKGKWKSNQFGNVLSFLQTNTFSRNNMNNENGEVQNIHYGDILIKFKEIIDCHKTSLPYLNRDCLSKSITYVESGDVIIADTAEDSTVGKAVELRNVSKKIVSGLHTILCRPSKNMFSSGWLGYFINSDVYHKQLMPLITGVKVSGISKRSISNTMILIPTLDEQTEIVKVLSTADREIELLKKNLEAEKQKKKALMQLLLTGIVRVNV